MPSGDLMPSGTPIPPEDTIKDTVGIPSNLDGQSILRVDCPSGTGTCSSSILMPSWLLMPSRLLMPYRHKITCLPSTIATTTSTSLARKSLAARHRSPRPDLSSFLMPSWLLMPSRHRLVQQHITYLPIRQKNRDTNAINWNCSPALHRSPTQAHCTVVSAP